MSLSGGTILFPCARHVILYLVLVQPRKRPDIAENISTGMGGFRSGGGGGGRGSNPPERSLKIGFLSNTCQDPLINCKNTMPEFNDRPSSGCQRNAI